VQGLRGDKITRARPDRPTARPGRRPRPILCQGLNSALIRGSLQSLRRSPAGNYAAGPILPWLRAAVRYRGV